MNIARRVERLEEETGVPSDVRNWTDKQLNAYLVRHFGHVPSDEELEQLIEETRRLVLAGEGSAKEC